MLKCRPPNITNLDDLMEEGFNLLLSKRRTNQLSSDSSLVTSPESKKLKEGDISYSSEGERNEEGDDICPEYGGGPSKTTAGYSYRSWKRWRLLKKQLITSGSLSTS